MAGHDGTAMTGSAARSPRNYGRTARRAFGLGALAASLTAGCIGLWRGDYYAGRSTGDLQACVPFNFDVSIEEGGRIAGLAATTYPWGTASWDVSGMITGGEILLETRTEDPRVAERRLWWRGRRHAVYLEVTEEEGRGCPAPRSATLHRK
jgi:hypothetical protein